MDSKQSRTVSATAQIVANILETRYECFDEATLCHARSRIVDTVGCLIAGVNAPGNLELVDLVKDWGGKEEATILISGGKVPAQNAAMVNSIMARSFDNEPNTALIGGVVIPSHITGTTVMTALTLGEMTGVSGKEMITSMLVAEDVASRILAAASSVKRRDSIGTVNAFGATALAGRMLGLSQNQMRNALGICLDQVSGNYQNVWDRTISFKLTQGLSARNGVFSAQLALKGWTAAEDPLLGKFGYYDQYFDDLTNIGVLTEDLGKKYYTETHFKPYPSCRCNHGPIDCVLSLIRNHQIRAHDIKQVIVYVHPGNLGITVGRPFSLGDLPYANALFSYQYTVASAFVRGSVSPGHFGEESIRDPEVNALVDRINLAKLPSAAPLGARVEVITNDGRELSASVDTPKGDQVANPVSYDEIVDKFWANVHFSNAIAQENARQLLMRLEELEDLDSLDKIIELLVPG